MKQATYREMVPHPLRGAHRVSGLALGVLPLDRVLEVRVHEDPEVGEDGRIVGAIGAQDAPDEAGKQEKSRRLHPDC